MATVETIGCPDRDHWPDINVRTKWPDKPTGGSHHVHHRRQVPRRRRRPAEAVPVGSHDKISSLDDLDPTYKQLLDKPIACILGLIGNDGLVNQTPMWFDYAGDKVFVNVATQRKKVEWIRKQGKVSILLVNPENAYHWLSIKATVEREVLEDDPDEGPTVTAQLDKIWTKYTGSEPPYGLCDPSIDERRVLFICAIDRVATFGKP
jgi:general stress protein 26